MTPNKTLYGGMTMTTLEELGKMFADDIKEYVAKGGNLDDLDPFKIYEELKESKEEDE